MAAANVQLVTEGGRRRRLRPADAAPGQTLADFLDAKGFPLNQRCGGRGLCKGCLVEIDGRPRRACQFQPSEFASASEWRIPETSRRDQTLHGVSVFEIRTAMPKPEGTGLGLALDIGTTTVAGALWDLASGQCLAHASRANPQSRYGDNVLSRISFALEHDDGSQRLQEALVKDCLNPILKDLSARSGRDLATLQEATATGNPIMLHTLAGASLNGFAAYPFTAEFLAERIEKSTTMGLASDCDLALLPSPGPFVGADIAAGALAAGLHERTRPILLIDFGTNGEILLKHGANWLATATAAGPAFEGGRLNCGAAVRTGVITALKWTGEGWACRLHGDAGTAWGLAGSAYVDFMAQGLEHGLINDFGRFDRSHRAVHRRGEGDDTEWAITLADNAYVTEPDVAELLQAKAAIGGGVMALLEVAGIGVDELETVFVAGGFGYHLNPRNAVSIGLLPNVPLEQIEMIGNASLGGASLCLHPQYRAAISDLASACHTVELNQIQSFEDHFTDALCLAPME